MSGCMKINILEYLEEAAAKYPDKCAYFDEEMEYTYSRILADSKAVGTKLIAKLGVKCRPVLIFMEKSPRTLAAFWGCLYR